MFSFHRLYFVYTLLVVGRTATSKWNFMILVLSRNEWQMNHSNKTNCSFHCLLAKWRKSNTIYIFKSGLILWKKNIQKCTGIMVILCVKITKAKTRDDINPAWTIFNKSTFQCIASTHPTIHFNCSSLLRSINRTMNCIKAIYISQTQTQTTWKTINNSSCHLLDCKSVFGCSILRYHIYNYTHLWTKIREKLNWIMWWEKMQLKCSSKTVCVFAS